jgi:hypothetical protein
MSMASILARLERIERKLNLDRTTGNWVIGLSGQLVWDPWDFPEPTEEEAAGTMQRILAQLDQTAERLRAQPGYEPPTPEQLGDARRAFEGLREKYAAEKAAVRAFTAKVERERAERAA